jgi:hypothetical protein
MATTLGFRRFLATILAAAGLAAGETAKAGGNWMPMLPDQDFYDFQLFAPPDLDEYGIYQEAHDGLFFSYDRLLWAITPPAVRGVAETPEGNYLIPADPISPEAIVQLNNQALLVTPPTVNPDGSITYENALGGVYVFGSDPLRLDLNTSWMRTKMSWGNRYEGGWIYDNQGMSFSYLQLGQSQEFQTVSEFAAGSPTQTIVQTSSSGSGAGGVGAVSNALISTSIETSSPPPDHLISQKLTQFQNTELEGGSAAVIIRRDLGRRGSGTSARFGLGPRYLQLADRYKLGYESNQYAFNVGGNATDQGGTGAVGTGAGGTGAGGTGAGGTGAGGTGAGTNNLNGGTFGGGTVGAGVVSTSAGDVLGITGYDTLTGIGAGTPLQTGQWETDTYNNIVGPEFSMAFETSQGRWKFLSEFKFTAGMNWQNNLYRGANFPNTLGADYLRTTFNLTNAPSTQTSNQTGGPATQTQNAPPPMFIQLYGVGQSNATNSAEHRFVFTPIGEWRFGTEYRVSQAILLRAGYTGMWLGSVARASTNTGYKSEAKRVRYADVKDPTKQADPESNPWIVKEREVEFNQIGPVNGGQEYVFTNGIDFGIEVRY